jgi:hypothetical protein
MRARPEVVSVVCRCHDARKRRRLMPLRDFIISFHEDARLEPGALEDVRWRLSLVLSDDGDTGNTEWMLARTREASVGAAGLLTLQASLEEPIDLLCAAQLPLDCELAAGMTVEDALAVIIDVARDWTERLAEGDSLDEFRSAVVGAVAAARELTEALSSLCPAYPLPRGTAEVLCF